MSSDSGCPLSVSGSGSWRVQSPSPSPAPSSPRSFSGTNTTPPSPHHHTPRQNQQQHYNPRATPSRGGPGADFFQEAFAATPSGVSPPHHPHSQLTGRTTRSLEENHNSESTSLGHGNVWRDVAGDCGGGPGVAMGSIGMGLKGERSPLPRVDVEMYEDTDLADMQDKHTSSSRLSSLDSAPDLSSQSQPSGHLHTQSFFNSSPICSSGGPPTSPSTLGAARSSFQSGASSSRGGSAFDLASAMSSCTEQHSNSGGPMGGLFSDDEWTAPSQDLQRRLIEQMQLLFSDENLVKDAFLRKHVLKNKDGFVNLKLITSFKRIKTLTKDWRTLAYSIQNLRPDSFLMNRERTKVKRTHPLPDFEGGRSNRTVVVFNLPPPPSMVSSIASVGQLFASCGEMASIRILRPDKPLPSEIRRHIQSCEVAYQEDTCTAVIEFENGDSVHRAVEQQQLINQALRETMTPAHPQNQQVSPSAQVPPGPIAELLVQELDQTRKTSSHASSQSAGGNGSKRRKRIEEKRQLFINSRSAAITESLAGGYTPPQRHSHAQGNRIIGGTGASIKLDARSCISRSYTSTPAPGSNVVTALTDPFSKSAANSRCVSPSAFGFSSIQQPPSSPSTATFCKVVGGFGQLSLPQDRSGALSRGGSSESLSGSEYSAHSRGRTPFAPGSDRMLRAPSGHFFSASGTRHNTNTTAWRAAEGERERGRLQQSGSHSSHFLSPPGSSFQSISCSSPSEGGSNDHLSGCSRSQTSFNVVPTQHQPHQQTNHPHNPLSPGGGRWLSPHEEKDSRQSMALHLTPATHQQHGQRNSGRGKFEYPIHHWNEMAKLEAPSAISERRYSDIPVHRTTSGEQEAIMRPLHHHQSHSGDPLRGQTAEAMAPSLIPWKRTSFSLDQQCLSSVGVSGSLGMGSSDSQLLLSSHHSQSTSPSPSFAFLDEGNSDNMGGMDPFVRLPSLHSHPYSCVPFPFMSHLLSHENVGSGADLEANRHPQPPQTISLSTQCNDAYSKQGVAPNLSGGEGHSPTPTNSNVLPHPSHSQRHLSLGGPTPSVSIEASGTALDTFGMGSLDLGGASAMVTQNINTTTANILDTQLQPPYTQQQQYTQHQQNTRWGTEVTREEKGWDKLN